MQIVEIFINELSWDSEKYTDFEVLKNSIDHFQQILSFIIQKSKNYPHLSLFFNSKGLETFLKDEQVESFETQNLLQIRQRLKKSKDWEDEEYRKHSNQDAFYYLNLTDVTLELVTNTSLAEITQRKLTNSEQTFLLLNFANSRFKNQNFLSILKHSFNQLPEITHIEQADSLQSLKKWLRVEIDWRNAIQGQERFERIKSCFQNYKLYNFDFDNWNPANNYLPLTEISNQLVDNDWNSFRDNLRKNASQKEAIISQISKEVTMVNGYQFNEIVSKLNKSKEHKREIYSAGISRNTIYLSVDFEKGGFEICDFDGFHLGEFWFDGSQTQQADKTGKHNIQIS